MIKPSDAQSIPKPSVPEFRLTFTDRSYDVAPVYGLDEFSGKTVLKENGYHIQDKLINLTITNQSHPSDQSLFYNISTRGHFGNEWQNYSQYPYKEIKDFISAQTDPITVLMFGVMGNNGSNSNSYDFYVGPLSNGDKIDFRVSARIGVYYRVNDGLIQYGTEKFHYEFSGQSSDWSKIQTISIPDGKVTISASINPTVTPTPTLPELSWLVIVPLLVSLFSVAVLVRYRKVKHG
jgi:hypothetical protein